MNKSEECAKALAHAAELVENANKQGCNFAPIAELLYIDRPDQLAKDLLDIYFELTKFIINSDDGYSCLGGALYSLRLVHEAFVEMHNSTEPTVILQVNDTPKAN